MRVALIVCIGLVLAGCVIAHDQDTVSAGRMLERGSGINPPVQGVAGQVRGAFKNDYRQSDFPIPDLQC